MNGAPIKALRPIDTGRVKGILRQLGRLWESPGLADLPVELNPRLSRTLGRLVGRPWRIEIGVDHWCPVCQSSRKARRPVKAWRCAACVAAGLDGTLEIARRTTKPTKAP